MTELTIICRMFFSLLSQFLYSGWKAVTLCCSSEWHFQIYRLSAVWASRLWTGMRAIDNVHMANLLFTASQQTKAQTETNNPKVKRQGTLCHLSLHSSPPPPGNLKQENAEKSKKPWFWNTCHQKRRERTIGPGAHRKQPWHNKKKQKDDQKSQIIISDWSWILQ